MKTKNPSKPGKYREFRRQMVHRMAWTHHYRPFIMGGNVWRQIAAVLPMEGPYDLGRGYKGYVLKAPDGESMIVEALSGGLVGPDLDKVRTDVREGNATVMDQQVTEARILGKNADTISAKQFWHLMGHA